MSIARSRKEIAAESGEPSDLYIGPYDIDQPCFHCGNSLHAFERPWTWVRPGGRIVMHQHCLINWLPAVLVDAEIILKHNKQAEPLAPRHYGVDGNTKKKFDIPGLIEVANLIASENSKDEK